MANDVEPLPEFPKKDDRQFGYRVARSAIAGADALLTGGIASAALLEIVDSAIGAPLEKRRLEWFVELGRGFEELRCRVNGFDPGRLGDDPEFVSAVAEATSIAMRTHREEKRRALRNAVLNIAAGFKVDEILRGAFMGYVDRFSPLHLKVLRLLAAPQESAEMVAAAKGIMAGSQHGIVEAAVPELKDQPQLLDRIVADLAREDLAEGSLKALGSASSLLAKRTTASGDAFLAFIAEPEGDVRRPTP